MRKEPQTYIEWVVSGQEKDTLGVAMLLTHYILKQLNKEGIKKIFDILSAAFEKRILEDGLRPMSITYDIEDDLSARKNEIAVRVDVQKALSLEAYANKSFHDAEEFYQEIKRWENKSWWQYMKWCFKRRFV